MLPEASNALTLFSCLADQPWAIWLDSCDSQHIDSRYDIIAWQPRVCLSTYGHSTEIHWHQDAASQAPAHTYHSEEDPLTLVKRVQQQVFSDLILPTSNLPFKGGALGYFGYDLGRRFEVLPQIAQHDIELPEMAVGIYDQAIVFDRDTGQGFLICPEHKHQAIGTYLLELLSNRKSNNQANNQANNQEPNKQPNKQRATSTDFTLTSNWQSNMDKAAYSKKFDQVKDYLLSGDCYQINLAQRFCAQYQGDEFAAYLQLRSDNQAPFSAFIRLDNAAILSISPERFLQLHQNKVQSKPIKGTRARSQDVAIDLANARALKIAEKDRAENLMIVDLLRNDISKTCLPGSVRVPKLFDVESFPAVHHLVSTVEGVLAPQYDGTDLLRAAFPGGSITGAPKIRAMAIIEQLEPHRRSVYCGAIGYLSACGNMDTSITIRTLVCEKNHIYCWAGGGLVADSKVDCEYQETFDKVSKILPVLTYMQGC